MIPLFIAIYSIETLSDECRFPHVLPDVTNTHPPHFNGRGPRPKDNARNGPNGIPTIEEKMAHLNVREV